MNSLKIDIRKINVILFSFTSKDTDKLNNNVNGESISQTSVVKSLGVIDINRRKTKLKRGGFQHLKKYH